MSFAEFAPNHTAMANSNETSHWNSAPDSILDHLTKLVNSQLKSGFLSPQSSPTSAPATCSPSTSPMMTALASSTMPKLAPSPVSAPVNSYQQMLMTMMLMLNMDKQREDAKLMDPEMNMFTSPSLSNQHLLQLLGTTNLAPIQPPAPQPNSIDALANLLSTIHSKPNLVPQTNSCHFVSSNPMFPFGDPNGAIDLSEDTPYNINSSNRMQDTQQKLFNGRSGLFDCQMKSSPMLSPQSSPQLSPQSRSSSSSPCLMTQSPSASPKLWPVPLTPYHPMFMMMMMSMMNSDKQSSPAQLAHSVDFESNNNNNPLGDQHLLAHYLSSQSSSSTTPLSTPVTNQKPRQLETSPPEQPPPGNSKRVTAKKSSNRRVAPSTSKALTLDSAPPSHDKFDGTNEVKSKNPTYRCHLCSYTGDSKQNFNAHMNSHFDHKCPHCDYTSRTEGRLKRHIRDFHSETPPETWSGNNLTPEDLLNANLCDMSDDELTPGGTGPNPARNRKYRCKQCGYVAVAKHDFWEHTRGHIKTNKMLSCPKCNFVTEYKHHLEYHLRNHFGSKPFKCGKCNYSCVNKSMLNSHMKSHSNIYQYRCEDCTYATKYCHSLKLHLRKYQHKPATVLNLDGTPNPYPVIDVYGTRRGPRPKKTNGTRRNSFRQNRKGTTKNAQAAQAKKVVEPTENCAMNLSISCVPCSPSSTLSNDSTNLVSPHLLTPKQLDEPVNSSNDSIKNSSNVTSPSKSSSSTCSVSSSSAISTMPVQILRCNYCSFQTECKPDFSNHLLEHVRHEKLTLLQKKFNVNVAAPRIHSTQASSSAAEVSMVIS